MAPQSFLVIDGNSLAHRAFHAIPILSTSQGEITNAVYGFAAMLLKILGERKPRMVAVCFDRGRITFRHGELETYKGTRKATPDELRPQFPLIKEMLSAMRIPVLEMEGYEADDLIGTAVALAEKEKISSLIVTGDRDALQLVSPLTTVLLTRKGITDLEEFDEGRVWEKYGLTPAQLVDLKGLTGDVSDNIPGVPGIGEKTGAKLISEFGSLENLLNSLDRVNPRLAAKIGEYADQARLSRRLAAIERNVPVDFNPARCLWEGPDYDILLPFFSRLEFKSLIKVITQRAGEDNGQAGENRSDAGNGRTGGTPSLKTYRVGYTVPENGKDFETLQKKMAGRRFGLALEGSRGEGLTAAAVSLADGDNFYVPAASAGAMRFITAAMGSPRLEKICFNAKSDMRLLGEHGIGFAGLAFDVMIAAYLLNPGAPNRDINDLALEHLNVVLPAGGGPPGLCARADAARRLAPLLEEKIKLAEMERLYYEVENPLVQVLADMEAAGVKVDAGILAEMSAELGARIDQLTETIYRLAGEKFNINSTRQLGQILFEKLQLPVIKKTKTGYSTDAAVLEELADTHEIIRHLILHRQLMKLKTTYVDGLSPLIDPSTGLVHTTFHQNITATGRLSSAEPNLQNIPIRLEEGRRIRKVFKPRRDGNVILAADYSQIELRILAHLAGDPVLLEAFRENQDIHTRTASEVFGVAVEEVTADMRGRAKAVNFGIIYGISDFGLARDIRVSRQEAGRYIKNYFERYKGARAFIDRTISEAREKGYVTTILNRRRYLPDLFSPNKAIRNFGERAAINTPIQGSAADIIKLAMVRIWNELRKRSLETKMVLQVHDELIFDVPEREIEEVRELVRDCMENAVRLDVPLVVDMKAGPNWYDVKRI
ncbi:MAG: DNA polymerase I [Peptococcaceae bacterium]|nr:DNA polymerase I [Peptococcaceae bacterium]